jgi:transcriptional regulator with XRE-family HTH domain
MSNGIGIEMNLQAERSARGMTQAELGLRVGVSQATISLWENLKAQPDEVQLEALRTVFRGGAEPNRTANPEEEPEGLETIHSAGCSLRADRSA